VADLEEEEPAGRDPSSWWNTVDSDEDSEEQSRHKARGTSPGRTQLQRAL
jgi:hypothetical protein